MVYPQDTPYDLNNSQHAVMEWLEFADPDQPDDLRYRVNTTFLLSNYECIFGRGCPSIKPQMETRHDCGCCNQGAGYYGEEDVRNVAKWFKKLTFKDMPEWKLRHAREHGWSMHNAKGEAYKTRKLNGACIFSNEKSDDPNAPAPGCAFHLLGQRLGVDHTEIKPEVCWTVPILVEHGGETTVHGRGPEVVTITAQGRGEWGGDYPEDYNDLDQVTNSAYLGWWCTDTPDAYIGENAAYVYFENELRKIMGDAAYDRMVKLLTEYGARRSQMPGERVNGGNPTIGTIESLVASLKSKQRA